MTDEKKARENTDLHPNREKDGRFKKGIRLNPYGRPKGGFNSRTWYEARLKDELPNLIELAIKEIKTGSSKNRCKVLTFLLGRLLPVKPILERENPTALTANVQENVIKILNAYVVNKNSTDETQSLMEIVQKQIEIQQCDYMKLAEIQQKQSEMIEDLKRQLDAK